MGRVMLDPLPVSAKSDSRTGPARPRRGIFRRMLTWLVSSRRTKTQS